MKSEDVRVGSLVEIVRSSCWSSDPTGGKHQLADTGKIGLVLRKDRSYNSYLVLVEDRSLVFNSYEFEVLSED